MPQTLSDRLRPRLHRIYGDDAERALDAILAATADFVNRSGGAQQPPNSRWSERDVVLITYADLLRSDDKSPLATLTDWLRSEGLHELIGTVHLLPFFPYSSDDGFSVIDFLEVDPRAGTWDDVERMSAVVDLMFDLVLNHCSQQNEWFQRYLSGEAPYDRYFVEADPGDALSMVVRPRSSPLLTPFETSGGLKHVWTTFSEDQVDLNYAEPAVLAEMLRVLLEYAARGARIIRLDAVAFLWKCVGTECLHLGQTHEVVKLMRDVLEIAAPGVLVLTETNVPHVENTSYFGAGDEAHMVYQFSLPPLLLDAFTSGDASAIREWLANLAPPPTGCTFFNFTASHDGVGLRPLEGLVSDERLGRLVDAMKARGGKVNMRRRPDGSDAPYELNITYVDALRPDAPHEDDAPQHARRFLASQALMLGLAGMPAVYFHSLVGTQNDYDGVTESGQNRRINRHKYRLDELRDGLAKGGSLQQLIYDGYRQLLNTRINQPAFHPDGSQQVLDTGAAQLLAFARTSIDGAQRIVVAVNFSEADQSLDLAAVELDAAMDLISGARAESGQFPLRGGQAVWLVSS